MKLSDLSQETYRALLINKARSGLTILGIVIGIGSVIALISIGQGAQGTIQASIQSLGSNLVIVMPGAQRTAGFTASAGRGSAQTLTLDDSNAIQQDISLAALVAPEVDGRYQVTAPGTNTNTEVIGTTSSYTSVRNLQVDSGTFITDSNVQSLSKVAVIGPQVESDLFGDGVDAVGQSIRIKGIDFQVIGVTVAKGGTGFNNPDDNIYIPISVAQQFFTGNKSVSSINIQATSQSVMTNLQDQITNLLLARHNISDPTQADFSTVNQSDIVATASSVTNTFTILLGSVAGISLVVGGIGIMNMMLTTVTERTREIGLRKAIGATRRDINLQFLTEAVMLTFVGGAVGVALGWSVSWGVSHFGGIATSVSWFSIVLAFSVSAFIGIVFGFYPARRASKLNPIEALRYE